MPELKLDHFLPYRLSIASNRVSAAIASTYQALFGLKIPEWRLIAVIAEGAGAKSRFDIGLVIAMGMTIGTLFTLFVTPAVYTLLARDRRGMAVGAAHEGVKVELSRPRAAE